MTNEEAKRRIIGNCASILKEEIPVLKRAKKDNKETYDMLYGRLCKRLEVFFEGTMDINSIKEIIDDCLK